MTCCRCGHGIAGDREGIAVDELGLVQLCPCVQVAEAGCVSGGQKYRQSFLLGRQADRSEIRSLVSSVSRRSELLLRRSGGGAGCASALVSPRIARMGSSLGGAITARVLLYSIVLAASAAICVDARYA